MNEVEVTTSSRNDGNTVLPAVFFLGIKVVRYRIVRDSYNGFECQKWRIWFPFWIQMGFTNTHPTLEKAINYITNRGVVLSS